MGYTFGRCPCEKGTDHENRHRHRFDVRLAVCRLCTPRCVHGAFEHRRGRARASRPGGVVQRAVLRLARILRRASDDVAAFSGRVLARFRRPRRTRIRRGIVPAYRLVAFGHRAVGLDRGIPGADRGARGRHAPCRLGARHRRRRGMPPARLRRRRPRCARAPGRRDVREDLHPSCPRNA